MHSAQSAHSAAMLTRTRLATAAMAGVVLYVLIDVVLQLLPPHYSPISDAESNLAVGPFGWLMNLNFLGRAVLSGCAIAALARCGEAGRLRTTGLALFAIAGVMSGVLAFFPTDVSIPTVGDSAGPTSTATAELAATTPAGLVHLVVATIGFLVALAAFAVLTRWLHGTAELRQAYPPALGCLLLAVGGIVFLAASIVFAPQVLGLAERICLAGILGWVFVVCAAVRSLPTR